MGQFGDKTYESDYIEDLIDDYDLDPDFRKDRILTSLDVKEILNEEGGSEENFLGIVSYIIDTYDSHKILLSPKNLRKALAYAGNLLKDFDYACRWFTNWNDRIEALEEEMRNVYVLLNPSIPFDFSKYEKVDQDSLLNINNWRKFDENHKFYVINYLSKNPEPKAADILRADIIKFQSKSGNDVPSRLVLAAIALSKIDEQDAINIIFQNVNDSFSWVREVAKKYLTDRLNVEKDQQICIKINEIITNL